MDESMIEDLRRMAQRWTDYANKTFLANGGDDRYARGLEICAEQLNGELTRIAKLHADLQEYVQQTCPGGC